jgi:hypothetical protein
MKVLNLILLCSLICFTLGSNSFLAKKKQENNTLPEKTVGNKGNGDKSNNKATGFTPLKRAI